MRVIIKSVFILFFVAFCSNLLAQKNLIPTPQKVNVAKSGSLKINTGFYAKNVSSNPEWKYLSNGVEEILGVTTKKPTNLVQFINIKPKEGFHDYYLLNINNRGIQISSTSPRSALYAIQTLMQLLREYKSDGLLPFMEIEDYAKFPYRGMHLDVCRHFFTIDEVKNYIDYLSWYKINKFHWHLTDDQGWRIEIKSHPKLTEIGAYRPVKPGQSYPADKLKNGRYGGYYTQEQIREVVAYAKKLHIDIIPEIEMPGHAQAALAAYPELSCTGGPFEVGTEWGVMDEIFCPKEETFALLEDVIDEVITLFPYNYIHIGGDEAPKTRWEKCAHCQAMIKRLGLKDEHELQSYFITRMEKYINSKGKKIIGWDEILEGGLAPNATVMSWRGEEGAVHAAKQGNDAIMTPVGYMYFDYFQGNPESEPAAFGAELKLDKVYSFNPIPDGLTREQSRHILGPQANMWAEHIKDFKHVQYMLFPRLFALSEVGWGTNNFSDYHNFEKRVLVHMKMLDEKGIDYGKAIFELNSKLERINNTIVLSLSSLKTDGVIRYTTDGSIPNSDSHPYKESILLNKQMEIKAGYFVNDKLVGTIYSLPVSPSISTGMAITLDNQPAKQYSDMGAVTLVNGLFGSPSYFRKNWLGFDGQDLVATIDLMEAKNFSTINMNTLDNKGDWIHAAIGVEILVSNNGTDYISIKKVSKEEIDAALGRLSIQFSTQNARYIKVIANCQKNIPKGYTGAGQKAWLFVDEIAVY